MDYSKADIIKFSEIFYKENVGKNSKEARKVIMELDYKNNHKYLQMIGQTYLDEAIFENYDQMRSRVNFHKLYYANFYTQKSLLLNDKCLRALWVLAKIYEKYNDVNNAILTFKEIIKTKTNYIIHDKCISNLEIANMIINDSKFELYRIYFYIDKIKAEHYLNEYQQNLKRGIDSIYKPFSKYKAK